MRLRLATWNVNSIRTRMPSVLRWLKECRPDVLLMQETKVTDYLFPRGPLEEAGYEVAVHGQKRYNGVAMASRLPLEGVAAGLPTGYLSDQARAISATVAGVRLLNVYVPNGATPESPRFAEKLAFLEELERMSGEWDHSLPCIMAGDFNVAPGPDDVFDPGEMEGRVCYHPEERRRLASIVRTGLVDLYRSIRPAGKAYTWWDYRAAAFRRNRGMRLDLLLATPGPASALRSCEIHRDVRSWERPSDHVPVTAEMELDSEGSET
jgi:exodeoxyribonuclease-3